MPKDHTGDGESSTLDEINIEEALTEALEVGGLRHCANCFSEFKEPAGMEQLCCSTACADALEEVTQERAGLLYYMAMRWATLGQNPDATKQDHEDAKALLTGMANICKQALAEDAAVGRPLPREPHSPSTNWDGLVNQALSPMKALQQRRLKKAAKA
jgi:hypothetical protein